MAYFYILLCLYAPLQEQSIDPCGTLYSTTEMVQCYQEQSALTENELKKLTAQIFQLLEQRSPEAVKAFKASNEHWQKSRDSWIKLQAELYKGGTMAGLSATVSRYTACVERLKKLKGLDEQLRL